MRSGKLELRSSKMSQVENLLGIELTKGDVHIVESKGYFGNDTLGHNEQGTFGMAGYTVRAIEDVEVGILDLDAIRSVVVRREEELSKSITMQDLDMIRILGAGTFGKVWLVTRKGSKSAYALKVQVKKQLIEYNQAEGVIREKNIMAQLDHPFIIKLVGSWKDDNKLYMLLKMYQVRQCICTSCNLDSSALIWFCVYFAREESCNRSFILIEEMGFQSGQPSSMQQIFSKV